MAPSARLARLLGRRGRGGRRLRRVLSAAPQNLGPAEAFGGVRVWRKKSERLGQPIPLDEHACSVSMPRWMDVVGYEEGDPQVKEALACGYPRFVYHPHVAQLCDTLLRRHRQRRVDAPPTEACFVLPTFPAAVRFRDFLLAELEPELGVSEADVYFYTDDVLNYRRQMHVQAVIFPEALAAKAKAFWQHTGDIVSSRQASAALRGLGETLAAITPAYCAEQRVHCSVPCSVHLPDTNAAAAAVSATEPLAPLNHAAVVNGVNAYEGLRRSISELCSVRNDDVYLSPTGMGAVSLGLRLAQEAFARRHRDVTPPPAQAVVFGFPYIDTLKLGERRELSPGGCTFFEMGNEADLADLERLVAKAADPADPTAPIAAVFTEFPSNPLLRTPDLHRLKEILAPSGIPLIVDDTISNFANVNLFGDETYRGADLIVSSLTKLFSGRGDAMGGSLVLNPASDLYPVLKNAADVDRMQNARLDAGIWEGLHPTDAAAIYINSRDFLERSQQINETAHELVHHVEREGGITSLYYPALTVTGKGDSIRTQRGLDPLYERFLKPEGGAGSLFSVVFDEAQVCPREFYDNLACSKGPSLGTNFTLCSPYTILAHYGELQWAEHCGVAPNLVRISVGLEDVRDLKAAWTHALEQSRIE